MINYLTNRKIIILLSAGVVVIIIFNKPLGTGIMIFLILNYFVFIKCHNIIPDIFKSTKRNYSKIIIGSKYFRTEKDDELIFTAYKRSFQINEIILKRMYSFLAENGSVHFLVDVSMDPINGINPPDIYFLHKVTITELNIKLYKIRYYFPLLINPLYFIKSLLWGKKESFSIRKRTENELLQIVSWIIDTQIFCYERNIMCEFTFYGLQDDIIYIIKQCELRGVKGLHI